VPRKKRRLNKVQMLWRVAMVDGARVSYPPYEDISEDEMASYFRFL
jgi:hypothetical protein